MVTDYACFNANKVNHHGLIHIGDALIACYFKYRTGNLHRRGKQVSPAAPHWIAAKYGNVRPVTLDRKFEGTFFSGSTAITETLSDCDNMFYKYIKSRKRQRRSLC